MELKRWEKADNYIGPDYSDYYILYGRNRDSNLMVNSNWDEILGMIDYKSDEDDVVIECSGHWACGWIEVLLIKHTNLEKVKIAKNIIKELNHYPLLDESDYYERVAEEYGQCAICGFSSEDEYIQNAPYLGEGCCCIDDPVKALNDEGVTLSELPEETQEYIKSLK